MLIDVETNAAQNLQEKAVFNPRVNLNHRLKETKYQFIDFQPPPHVSLNHYVPSQSPW